MRELRPVGVHVDARTDAEHAHAQRYFGVARTMLGFAQSTGGGEVSLTGLTKSFQDGTTVSVVSYEDLEFGNYHFRALIRVRLDEGVVPEQTSDARFPYLWVGRRTITAGTAFRNCSDLAIESWLVVWEPDWVDDENQPRTGQVCSGWFQEVDSVDEQGVMPLADLKADWDGEILHHLGFHYYATDRGIVWRDAEYYRARGMEGVPDREDPLEFWDEEIWCDPSDGEPVNTSGYANQDPMDLEIAARDRALGTISGSVTEFPDESEPEFLAGELVPGEYLIRVLRVGDPCAPFTESEDEVKVVCGKLPNQAIATYRIRGVGAHNFTRFTVPYGFFEDENNYDQTIPGGPCINSHGQFSAEIIVADPWAGSDIDPTVKETPGVEEGAFGWQCEFPSGPLAISATVGYYWSQTFYRSPSELCFASPWQFCLDADEKAQVYFAKNPSLAEEMTALETLLSDIIRNCDGTPKWTVSLGTPSGQQYAPAADGIEIAPVDWVAGDLYVDGVERSTSVIADSGDYKYYAGCPEGTGDCTGSSTLFEDLNWDSAICFPPYGPFDQTNWTPVVIFGLWFPETNSHRWTTKEDLAQFGFVFSISSPC